MTQHLVGTYRDANDTTYEVLICESDDGSWRVIDASAQGQPRVIETLTGDQDGHPQAEAIARDYLTTVGAHDRGAGPTAGEPIPEQGGSDARSHRRPRPPRQHRARDAALPHPAR